MVYGDHGSSVEFSFGMYSRATVGIMSLFVLLFAAINQVAGLCYYDPANATCCNGKVHAGDHLTCCGTKGFHYQKEVCCDYENGTLLPIPFGQNYDWGCCQAQVYRLQDSLCCNNRIIEIPDKNVQHWSYACCNGVAYNRDQHICCEDNLLNITSESESCCGKIAYDYRTDRCCEGNRLYKGVGNTHSCCGRKIYNWKNQTCEYPGMKIRKKPSTGELCGKNVLIDYETERCCNGNYFIVSSLDIQCCNQQLYNTTNQVCCESGEEFKIHNIVPHLPIGCCRTEAYNYDTQLCCSEQIVDVIRSSKNGKIPCCRFS